MYNKICRSKKYLRKSQYAFISSNYTVMLYYRANNKIIKFHIRFLDDSILSSPFVSPHHTTHKCLCIMNSLRI